jgi:hypothetical protein
LEALHTTFRLASRGRARKSEFEPRTGGNDVVRFRVPTALERQGDFSQSTDNNGNLYPLMRDNKWRFQATIEFEYPVPAGSDRMMEMAKAIQYCKECLVPASAR